MKDFPFVFFFVKAEQGLLFMAATFYNLETMKVFWSDINNSRRWFLTIQEQHSSGEVEPMF